MRNVIDSLSLLTIDSSLARYSIAISVAIKIDVLSRGQTRAPPLLHNRYCKAATAVLLLPSATTLLLLLYSYHVIHST